MRLIDADALMKELEREVELADDWKTAHEIANVVKYFPTIVPQRTRGKWIPQGWNDTYCKCSCCDAVYVTAEIPYSFCPNCGADMREGQDEAN